MFTNRTALEYLPLPRAGEFNQPSDLRKKIQNYSFLLTDRIGKGYSSTVYKGLDDLTLQEVAIKVIELRSLRDHTSRLMLQTEIDCFREVKHQNVLRYVNSFFTANNCYIITEYCSGSDLAKVLKQRGRLAEKEAAEYFMQIFEGYCAFNTAGYVHRDIKPANIFVARDGTLKLADFGFSKRRTLIDKENYNVGTPIYMPKESLTANIYNEKTDLWALGVTLYEMLFGEVPFRGKTEQQLRASIEKEAIYFPPEILVSAEIKDFIRQTLLNDPNLRMGIKQMKMHPWMLLRLSSRAYERKDTPQTPLESTINRISLPQESVVPNRSQEYFEGKQNRRSASSTQKLKLSMPNKGSLMRMTARQPLRDQTLNLTNTEAVQNKQNRLQNESKHASGVEGVKTLRKRKDSEVSCSSSGIQKIICLINYFRLLYKIYEKANHPQLAALDPLRRASKLLISRITTIFSKHKTSLQDRSNQFELDSLQWINFATSDRWPMYQFVIGKYTNKYKELILSPDSSQLHWIGANAIFSFLWENYNQLQTGAKMSSHQHQAYLEVIHLMHHLSQVDRIVSKEGWPVFAQKYQNKSEELLLQTFVVRRQNVLELEAQLAEGFNRIQTNIY